MKKLKDGIPNLPTGGKFDLAAIMSAGVKMPKTMQIEEIPINLIFDHEDNFFAVDDVQDLMDSIALVGLQQPLVVMAAGAQEDGQMGYILIAGHRRKAALQALRRITAPCIITKPAENELETLALIQTNTLSRTLDYAARMEAVRRTEEALLSLKEKGYNLPGKMRDRVAEITQEKQSEIARMKVIQKGLSAPLVQALRDKKISASVAYELARLDETGQTHFAEKVAENAYVSANTVQEYAARQSADWAKEQCPCRYIEVACSDYQVLTLTKCRESGKEVTCCHECPEKSQCKKVCWEAAHYETPEQHAEREAERQAKQQQAQQKAMEAFRQLPGSCLPERIWKIMRERCLKKSDVYKQITQLMGDKPIGGIPQENETDAANMPTACELAAICKVLDVSADWLLGLTEDVPQ